jgi:hypothetical protein
MQFINSFMTTVSETRHVHVFKVNTNLTMNPIKKRSIRLYPKVGPVLRHRMKCYQLEQTCSTGLLEVVE